VLELNVDDTISWWVPMVT